MSDVFMLSERQRKRIELFFSLAHGVPRVDDRRVLSGIVYVIRNGLQWKDAAKAYTTLTNIKSCFFEFHGHPRTAIGPVAQSIMLADIIYNMRYFLLLERINADA